MPDTTIISGPTGSTWSATPEYTFASTIAGSTFLCSVDGAASTPCTSPRSIGAFAPGSTHTFAVQAVSPGGVADPTPAVVTVSINATQVSSYRCEITPFLATDPYNNSDPSACSFFFDPGNRVCAPTLVCVFPPESCPGAAKCTLTTKASWTDGDTNVPWNILAESTVIGPSGGFDESGGSQSCTVADGQSGCAVQDTESLLGPAKFDAYCGSSTTGGGTLGSANDRDLVCTATVTITPAAPLSVLPVGTSPTIFLPTAGKLTLTAPLVGSHAVMAPATRRTRRAGKLQPLFKPMTITATHAGPVRFNPRLSPAAAASLKRHHKLTLKLQAKFIPADGSATLTRTLTTTLTVAPKRPPRCPTHPPKHQVRKRVACVPAGAP